VLLLRFVMSVGLVIAGAVALALIANALWP
jgi:hypothetical protein